MIRNKRIAWVFVASVAVNVLLMILRGQQFNLAEILGGTLGLMLVPYLFTFLVKWLSQLFKVKFDGRLFLITYAAGWALLVLANILA